MTKETQTVWRGASDQELLVCKGPDRFWIPLSTVDGKTLVELAGAVSDALKNMNMPIMGELCQNPPQ